MKVKSESKVAQSCPTPSDPMDCSPPGSSIHGIFQARVLEWGAKRIIEELYLNVISNLIDFLALYGTPLQYSCLENPWTEEPGGLQSMGSLRVGHD